MAIHELLYPLLTALDAVQLKSDVELGATEQKFNLLVHREIQREYALAPQVAFTMPILVGLDGVKKMSKSLGNYVGITESPQQMFGKLMSISDELMWSYYELLTDFEERVIVRLKEEVRTGVLPPIEAKMQLARYIIDAFHGVTAGQSARDEFQRVFRDRKAPQDVDVWRLKQFGPGLTSLIRPGATTLELSMPYTGREKWAKFLSSHYLNLVSSRTKAEELIRGKGLEVNGEIMADPAGEITLGSPGKYDVRIGKTKFLRIIVE